jgi:hypothetical protein
VLRIGASLLSILFAISLGFAQGSSVTISDTLRDGSGALVRGVYD